MSRVAQALSVLLGRALGPRNGPYIYTHPDAWRCARCGGAMFAGPKGRPYFHNCQKGIPVAGGSRVRYVGVRRHAARVWASVWENRPRVESGPPAHGAMPSWWHYARDNRSANRENVVPVEPPFVTVGGVQFHRPEMCSTEPSTVQSVVDRALRQNEWDRVRAAQERRRRLQRGD